MNSADMPATLHAEWARIGVGAPRAMGVAMAEAARRHPDALLYVHGGEGARQATLGAIHAAGRQLAGAFHALGVMPGDTIAMQLPNSLENAIIFQAAAALGCTLLPIVHIYGPHELAHILSDSGAVLLVTPDRWRTIDYADRLARLPDLPALRHRIVIGRDIPPGAIAYDALPMGMCPDVIVDPEAVALLLYTSGTTAAPKGVRHSAQSLVAELEIGRRDRPADESWLAPWPSGHIAGTLAILGHALLGRPMVLMESFEAAAAAELVARFGVTQTSGTPFHLAGMLEAAARDGHDLSSLKQFLIGATTVPPALVAASEAAGIRCCRCYGSTEMPTVSQCLPEDPLDKRLNTDGRPNPGVEVRLVDDNGTDVPTGAEGEIAVRGPERFLGYTDSALNAAAFLPGGWFLTGDIGRIDAEGFLAITDRKKDIIIRGGENISSREVEELLLDLPAVREAAAIGVPDKRLGEVVGAVVIVEDGQTVTLEAVNAAFRARGVARQKTPEHLMIVTGFPRTPSGKVQKAELRHMLVAQGLIPPR